METVLIWFAVAGLQILEVIAGVAVPLLLGLLVGGIARQHRKRDKRTKTSYHPRNTTGEK